MGTLASISLDLTKVDKSRLIKGKYLNLTLSVNDELDKYDNNVAAWESQSKEERESKVTRNFLGNGRVLWTDGKISLVRFIAKDLASGGKLGKQTTTDSTPVPDKTENLPF